MSWSVSAIGKPEAVARIIEKQFTESSPCQEPEESIRQSARKTIASSLAGQRPDSCVKVTASGSMQMSYDSSKPEGSKWGDPVQNSLQIEILPVYGFVE